MLVLLAACPCRLWPKTPDLARSITRRSSVSADYEAAQRVTMEEAADLERVVARDPDDLRATEKLITFYSQRGQKLMGWDGDARARRPHLCMIARHPESGLVRWPYGRRLDQTATIGHGRCGSRMSSGRRAHTGVSEAATFF